MESNNRPIPKVGTLGDWLSPTEEQSTTLAEQFATSPPSTEGYPDGVDSFGRYMLDWIEKQTTEVEHNR